MPAVDNSTDPLQYCDANQVGGHWCPEFDIMEANRHSFHVTAHKCEEPTLNGVYNSCDRAGQCTLDVLRNDDQADFGNSPNYKIDTTRAFHVRTEFQESDGKFVGYKTILTQSNLNGSVNRVEMSTGSCEYLSFMSSDITQMVFVLSNWKSDGNLDWL